mgnify:CR=1 FL=1
MKRMHRKKLSLAVVQALNAGVMVSFAAPMAYAQVQQVLPQPQAAPVIKIEVTGSRIPVPLNLEHTSPVTEVNAQDIKFTGLTSTSDILNQLPQAFADYGGNLSNGATGTATINLRNLGVGAHAGADRRQARAAPAARRFWATDFERDSGAADPARRSADRRCVRGLRLGRGRGRRELHHERPLRRRSVRRGTATATTTSSTTMSSGGHRRAALGRSTLSQFQRSGRRRPRRPDARTSA